MAGIVASTLRRRTIRHKMSIEAKYTAIDPGHMSLSPTGSGPPSRSPSFMKMDLSHTSSGAGAGKTCGKLSYHDFWPNCVNSDEQNLRLVEFESFDTLVPKANSWLQDNAEIHLTKCETVEKKVSISQDVASDSTMFTPKSNYAIYVKGLRLWYVDGADGSKLDIGVQVTPIEIGYMNIIPKCLDSSSKYPVYEKLPETYAAVNAYLAEAPLEGKILTIETVPLKLARRRWEGPEVDPDQTYFPDEYLRHVLYVTRIYFVYGAPEEELIGAQDFIPDYIGANQWYSIYGIYPKYTNLITAMQKAKAWMCQAKHVRVTNIQTLEAVFRRNPDNVHTGINFVDKVESCAMVRFVRVTYVQPMDTENTPSTYYTPPRGFSYKTFVPAAIKVGMCSGAPEYEPMSQTWERAKAWLKVVGRRALCAETFYHPVNRIWHNQDRGETTVMQGEWTNSERSRHRRSSRRQLVQLIRVYLDGNYNEPGVHLLPPVPQIQETNDCCNGCVVM